MRYQAKKKHKNRTKTGSAKKKNNHTTVVKKEVSGLLFIAIGVLLALAIISFHRSDPTGILEEGNIYKVQNWLGQFGATISSFIFQWTLGYPVVVFPLLIVVYGFYLLIGRPVARLTRFALLCTCWSVFVSMLLALPEALETFGDFQSWYPSGFIGAILAGYLVKIFSQFGAIFILSVIFLMLTVGTFHVRLSDIPNFIGRIFLGFFHLAGALLGILRSIFSRSTGKKRAAPAAASRPTQKTSPRYSEEFQDPMYQPSLPSEKEQEPPGEKDLEIVHNHRESQEKTAGESNLEEREEAHSPVPQGPHRPVKGPALDGEERGGNETGLGFEIQEAHQEKELDYDTLVRDSLSRYQFPSTDLLTAEEDNKDYHLSESELKSNARLLENTLAQFGVKATVNRVIEGPVITMYEVKPAQGVKISHIVGLADDLALAMRAKGIRMIAPIPGKAAIGIEIPNRKPSIVTFRSIMRSETFIHFTGNLPLGVGKTISGEVYCTDLTKTPHLLIAGATGSGKSVGINTMIGSLLYRVPPSDLKFVLIDPKKLELSIYAKLRDHYLAVCPELDEIVITHPQNAIMMLRSVVNEMEERYDKLASLGVREITHYNRKIEEYKQKGETSDEFRRLPYLVIVIDEMADLILSATREVEEPITRLAQMARAVGIHLVMATQRPSVDILTGLIKANFPARIAYQVATRPDSKVILDMYGAEKLIGNGDMLFMPPGKVKPVRLQNPLITTEEVERIIRHVRRQPKFPPYELKLVRARSTKSSGASKMLERDELFEKAKEIVIRYQQGSVSLLQRKLKIGYARAARIVDELEDAGIVGPPAQEGKAREVMVSTYSQDTE